MPIMAVSVFAGNVSLSNVTVNSLSLLPYCIVPITSLAVLPGSIDFRNRNWLMPMFIPSPPYALNKSDHFKSVDVDPCSVYNVAVVPTNRSW